MMEAKNVFFKVCMLVFLLIAAPAAALAQAQVNGTVVDSQNEPIIGATIVEKGNTSNATISDIDGNFTLKVAAGKKIVVSYVGMVSQEVTAGQNLKIVLQEDASTMDEVVVIGYTSKARRDLTGSVGSVSGAKLAAVPVASAAEALAGKIAGVQVTTVDGQPGADINIRIRGGSAISSSQDSKPLFIVDGFQTDNINDIPPTDIQSIDVLKDASLTAIYGARGGNGVVIVTTKNAQAGKVKVEFNAYGQLSYLAGKQEMLNTYEFVKYQLDDCIANNSRTYQFRRDFGNPNDLDIYKSKQTHDWQDELMGDGALTQMYNATVNGGNDKIRFSTSLTQHNQDGIITGSGVRRTNMNTKVNIQIAPNVRLLINPRFTYRRDLGAGASGIGTKGLIGVLNYKPTNGLREFTSVEEEWQDFNVERYWTLASPLDDINQNYNLKHSYNFTNQASLTWEIVKGLTFRSDIAQFWSFSDQNRFYGYLTDTAAKHDNMPVAEITNQRGFKYTWTNTLNYVFTHKEDHNFAFLLGQEIQHNQTTVNYQSSRYFPQDIQPRTAFNNMGLGSAYESTSSVTTPNRIASFFGQANYNFKHRYLLSATFRADGSTRFAPGNQWGYFPSVSGAWVISEEPWWNKDVVDNLKIRAAFGLSGNNNIGDDRWRYQYSIYANGGPSWGENPITQNGDKYYGSDNLFPNTEIKWETTVTRNLAADISLFKGRLTITPEVYWNTTRDLLYRCQIPTTTGYTYQWQNVGKVSNKGVELTIQGDILRGTDYVLSANFTMGMNKTKVEKINGTDAYIPGKKWDSEDNFRLVEGEEVGLIYGYVFDGLYGFDEFHRDGFNYAINDAQYLEENPGVQVKPTVEGLFGTAPGRIKLKDLNDDGKIDINDRTVIGNTNPKFQGGFGLSGQWKNFDFTANFNYMLDFDVINATAYDLSSACGASATNPRNVLAKFDYNNRWTYYGDIYNKNADGTLSIYNLNEPLISNSQHPDYLDVYKEINTGKTLWNPQDVTSRYTLSNFVEDGSFLRLNDLTIGYTLPKSITSKWGISRLRLYVTGSNLFCLTSYSGFDPEVDIQNGLTPNVDHNRYPRSHSFLFGLNLGF
ncbi:MAG: TonB-dependent receptor [Prevotella sp.]|nr:TonB-dependent receptor [Prevotella sp.]